MFLLSPAVTFHLKPTCLRHTWLSDPSLTFSQLVSIATYPSSFDFCPAAMKRRPLSQATLDQAVRDVEACRFTSNALDSAAGWHPDVLLALFNKGASNSAASELFKKNLKSHRLGGGTWTPPTTEPTSVQEMLGSMTPWGHLLARRPTLTRTRHAVMLPTTKAMDAEISVLCCDSFRCV
jgi:hypothetical protein